MASKDKLQTLEVEPIDLNQNENNQRNFDLESIVNAALARTRCIKFVNKTIEYKKIQQYSIKFKQKRYQSAESYLFLSAEWGTIDYPEMRAQLKIIGDTFTEVAQKNDDFLEKFKQAEREAKKEDEKLLAIANPSKYDVEQLNKVTEEELKRIWEDWKPIGEWAEKTKKIFEDLRTESDVLQANLNLQLDHCNRELVIIQGNAIVRNMEGERNPEGMEEVV
ncbi:unnamed protein product [Orchesella dallaii]|uniref:Uncharacterized protein n=1 Tax=Orchesella dallaii TaxID=48710 RepID=A0ABP1Q3F4_9HEXA